MVGNIRYQNTLDTFVKIIRYEGIRSLWTGLGLSMIMTVPSTAMYFAIYEKINNQLWPYLGFYSPMFSGGMARAITTCANSPIDMTRTFLQSQNSKLNGLQVVTKVIREGGFKNLWKGLYPTLWRDVPFSSMYWSGYELIKSSLKEQNNLNIFIINFISGVTSGTIATLLTHPFDVIKTRQQMEINNQKSILPTRELIKKIYKEEGLKSFAKGSIPRTIRVAPACAIMISSYEYLKSIIIKQRHFD